MSWLRRGPRAVVTLDVVTHEMVELQAEVVRLRQRCDMLLAITRLFFLVVRLSAGRLNDTRLPDGADKQNVLDAITRARRVLPLAVALRVLGLSPSRFHSWKRPDRLCRLADLSSCPRTNPTQLTPDEIRAMHDLTTSPDHRHLSIRGLALHAQRVAKVFAAPATWGRLIRERGWLRPRLRVHPATPKDGLRATRPNEFWHIDVTVIRLLDETRVYLHAVIDNYSRRILAWTVATRLEPETTCAVLVKAGEGLDLASTPATVVADSGVENVNGAVDALLRLGMLRRVLAQVEVTYSNSMFEAFWRSLKHQWLFLNTLDTLAAVERLVAFYVDQHNRVMPHSAFQGQTPEEMYIGTGAAVPQRLTAARRLAREARVASNRARHCDTCLPVVTAVPAPENLLISNVLQLHRSNSQRS